MERDQVDRIIDQWRALRADLDHSPTAVVGRINLLSQLLTAELERNFARFGISGGLFDVLASLRRAGSPYRVSPTRLFQQLLLSSGGMTHRLDKLEQAGLVERLPDPEDRRALQIGLTSKGLALIDEVIAEHLAGEEKLIAVLDATERECLAGLLRSLVVSLERGQGAPGADPAVL
jgi:DNA-binding MarR family transcriptional regulator